MVLFTTLLSLEANVIIPCGCETVYECVCMRLFKCRCSMVRILKHKYFVLCILLSLFSRIVVVSVVAAVGSFFVERKNST